MMYEVTNTIQRKNLILVLAAMAVTVLGVDLPAADGLKTASPEGPASEYFTIQVVDRQSGRGVPLVELRTTNNVRYFTDSSGLVAFHEPGLMDREVFFFVESHGYEFPKDGFGFQGVRLKTTPGTSEVLQIDRLNIAERLYRVTGQGIYRDSVLTGRPAPLQNPVLNGQVAGQDSVFTCLYRGCLFWMWGDTGRPSYPLGNFQMSGAVSELPGRGGLDPAVGVDLEYFVDEKGFSRPMSPLKEPGLVWLDGLLTVKDHAGRERMVAKFARLKDLGHVLERGLVVFNDATQTFEPLVREKLDFLPYANTGHAYPVSVGGRKYYYFTSPSPMGPRLRVRAQWGDVVDANRYEIWTALETGNAAGRPERSCRWVRFADLTGDDPAARPAVTKALAEEAEDVHVYDIESGRRISPHNGTVYFNRHRQRWIGIFVQHFGKPSNLGEVWYAEADTPIGLWVYARKIVTHNKYSFYNPKHHPHFDQDDGRTIFFEGTYSFTFSGSEENATPRYDYNQIMYRLNLDDPRLLLPAAVYQVKDKEARTTYLLRDGVTRAGQWGSVEAVAFYAGEPSRSAEGLIAVYANEQSDGNVRLMTESDRTTAEPLFRAMPLSEEESGNARLVCLYEYHHAGSGRYHYSTNATWDEDGWDRREEPLCMVWKAPSGPLFLDTTAEPSAVR